MPRIESASVAEQRDRPDTPDAPDHGLQQKLTSIEDARHVATDKNAVLFADEKPFDPRHTPDWAPQIDHIKPEAEAARTSENAEPPSGGLVKS